ncbi:endosomal peripheral membrane protein (Mon2), putative [Talaromyces stipitatus ATCC 10500]|uniref:Endosomal peripheral membrane protein (Mon2), putative n=1 Tax=Talaromyces stipitatus (strain ATCC 10500 / CBS 375.48 / QM 6759 / NRRL 1006) TaxID=441959 RepID=B8LWF1_TALSN|nr:endosomal peripheral membrane protein (Mon2), putative [Talaromyces stipitatus ATCC 10500]EED24262.1 endosomal peripheral membrane protein (Mon2), putative [Talaromyces stipitatus ATCC 10500]
MSSQILQAELSNLIQESKRKYSDLRNAAEQSLNDLKALPSTSEAQITADLIRRPHFVTPFILACQTRQSKLASIGVVCLQRLATSHAISPHRLNDTLSALRDITGLGQDVQLKILQTLPALLQNYSDDLSGELLAHVLEVCATLQASKVAAVSNTAAATLQQLVSSAYEKVSVEDGIIQNAVTVQTQVGGSTIDIGVAAYDALRILSDLCRAVEGEKLEFLHIKALPPNFVLELIESILVNNIKLFRNHPEQMQLLQTRLLPMTVKHLSERHNFAQTLRVTRILLVLLRHFMSLLQDECEMALGLLIHLLEPEASSEWKRVLCMEVFRSLHSEPSLIRLIYTLFDATQGRKDIVKDHMTALFKIASENPSLIGVSYQSTVPQDASQSRSNTDDQITLDAGGVAGVIAAPVNSADESVTGISSQWSTVRTPYLELLDKSEPPPPPETYIYSLVLNCLGAFAEGLARFIIPLTVTESKSKRRKRMAMNDREQGLNDLQRSDSTKSNGSETRRQTVPLNPLELRDHPQSSAITSSAGIIESCWPVILSTCSIFFYAALDADFYHNLVRSFQKLTHVAGLLRQSVARDAFLSTLGKATLPAEDAIMSTNTPEARRSMNPDAGIEQSLSAHFDTPKASFEAARASLSTRNLLCLRALLNLGIALGPTLDRTAWSILLETLQNADLVINSHVTASAKQTPVIGNGEQTAQSGADIPRANIGNEILAVSTAASKMFESTADYPDTSFRSILEALLGLLSAKGRGVLPTAVSPTKPAINQSFANSRILDDEMNIVLDRTKELCEANIERLSVVSQDEDIAWNNLNTNLQSIITSDTNSRSLRLKASSILNYVILQTMKHGWFEDDSRNSLQLRNLQSLQSQITSLYEQRDRLTSIDAEAHGLALDTLKIMLEQYGEAFTSGWDLIFELISSVFEKPSLQNENEPNETLSSRKSVSKARDCKARSPRLVRAAYASLQLIASDFLTLLPPSCLLELVDSLSFFASQDQDFNISLTTTTFFWNVSDFLQSQVGAFSIDESMDISISEESLAGLADDADISTSRGALWLLLLLRIVDLTTDNRSGIRNSAIHTLLRILDAYGPQLTSKAWHLCLNRVLFVMIFDIQKRVVEIERSATEGSNAAKEWIETSVVLIKGCADLIATFFDTIIQDPRFVDSWKRLLESFQELVRVNNYGIKEAIFASTCDIIKHAKPSGEFSKEAVHCAWLLWKNNHLAPEGVPLNLDEPNQDALIAYFRFFQQIYRLYRDELSEEPVTQILHHMRTAIWNAVVSRYSVDIDHQSTLQELVLDCMKTLCLDKDESQSDIVMCLADFSDAALTQWSTDRDKSRPSYVAFSKNSTNLLSWYISEHGIKADIFSDGALTAALQHLAHPISCKYEWRGKDREQLIWQKATTAAVKIVRVAVPYVESKYSVAENSSIVSFWSTVIDITRGIISADNYNDFGIPASRIAADEEFDIEAFESLVPLLIPSLGASNIPDSIRRDFACSLFRSSLIYLPQPMDRPMETLLENPLHDLYKIRRGRTYDPSPTARSRMAYVLIDTMFTLAQASSLSFPANDNDQMVASNTTSRIAIARSILPYLILRSFLPLKSYIADQPLRGLQPQPAPAHRELVRILDRLFTLQSEPAAIPDAPCGIASSSQSPFSASGSNPKSSFVSAKANGHESRLVYSKHLGWVYPLIVKCVRIAGKQKRCGNDDVVVLHHLTRILDAVCENDDGDEV